MVLCDFNPGVTAYRMSKNVTERQEGYCWSNVLENGGKVLFYQKFSLIVPYGIIEKYSVSL